MSTLTRRPDHMMVIDTGFGPCQVINASADGIEVTVLDEIGRTHVLTRHPCGYWSLAYTIGGAR